MVKCSLPRASSYFESLWLRPLDALFVRPGLPCNATANATANAAPPAYLSNCTFTPAFSTCTNVGCAAGYDMLPYYSSPAAWCTGGSLQYYGCGVCTCVLLQAVHLRCFFERPESVGRSDYWIAGIWGIVFGASCVLPCAYKEIVMRLSGVQTVVRVEGSGTFAPHGCQPSVILASGSWGSFLFLV